MRSTAACRVCTLQSSRLILLRVKHYQVNDLAWVSLCEFTLDTLAMSLSDYKRTMHVAGMIVPLCNILL